MKLWGGDSQQQQQQQSSSAQDGVAESTSTADPTATTSSATPTATAAPLFPPLGSASNFCTANGLIDAGRPSFGLCDVEYPMRFGAGSTVEGGDTDGNSGGNNNVRGKKTKYNQKRSRSSSTGRNNSGYNQNNAAMSHSGSAGSLLHESSSSSTSLFGHPNPNAANTNNGGNGSGASGEGSVFKFNTPKKEALNFSSYEDMCKASGKDIMLASMYNEDNHTDDDENEEDDDETTSHNHDSSHNNNKSRRSPSIDTIDNNHHHHEQNDNEDNNNHPNHPPWSPQQTTTTCEFTHKITQYSTKRDSGCKKAEYSDTTIDSAGNKWRLIVYVNGNGRASNHHLSLFLQVADAEELPFGWNKAVSYVLTLEHPNGGENVSINSGGVSGNGTNDNNNNNGGSGYAKRNPDKTFKMCPKAIDWGWSQFIASDRILREGYVDDKTDTLTVRASVTVKSSGIEIDPEDAELYLKCAVEEGNVEGVKACLAREASVNCQFKDDLYTPLHTACSVNAIGENSSSSEASTSSHNGNTSPGPIPEGSLEVLELLLERGADVNACNKWRETPLLIAANNGHSDAVTALLRSGADPGLCSEAGWSALTFAAHKGYDEIVSSLLHAGAPVNCRVTEDLSTPLHKACAGSKPGHLSAVHMLLEGDADVHALNKWRETPLLTAANHGQCEAVEALLDYGADPCKCTDTGWSPLSIAAYKGHDEVVRLLLEEGAPTEEDDPTLSALLQAATKGLPDTVMLLLEHGADHTVTTKKGDTALAILVEQNLIDAAVEMVTDYGASVPRCSRDRKKVQRARLLINLRLKQMQRDGTGSYSDDSDEGESSDADDLENSSAPLHHDNDNWDDLPPPDVGGGASKKKKGKKKNSGGQKSIAKAEAEARAAEEALLMELEAEEKERTAASEAKSAKKKKQKQKEKERMLREAEKAKAEAAALEAQKAKEQDEKKKRQLQLQEQRQQQQQKSSSPTSPSKKEVVIEISSNTVAKPAQEASQSSAKQPNSQKPNAKLLQKKEPSRPLAKSAKELTKGKTKEVPLAKASPAGYSVTKTEKKAPLAKSAPVMKKIPGDNPIPKAQPKRIPGDNPVVKKIPGDNPKVPVQQPRQNVRQTATNTQVKPTSPAKSKRGWESKSEKSTKHAEVPLVANQPKARQQRSQPMSPTPAPSTRDTKKPIAKKEDAAKVANRKDMSSPINKNKSKSDESTQSTANSTANDSLPPTPTDAAVFPRKVAVTPKPTQQLDNNSVDDQLANMANDVLGFLDFDSQPAPQHQEYQGYSSAHQTITPPMPAPAPAPQMSISPSPQNQQSSLLLQPMFIELPSVSTFRLEKINELFRRCSEAKSSLDNPLRVIDEHTLRVVLYRWIIRASHGTDAFIDPVIPSWEDEEFLKAFLQRQFISESRRSPANRGVHSIEVLRDAGAAMSEICLSFAKEIQEFQTSSSQRLHPNWSDADINVSGMQEGASVIIDWAGKSRLSIPYNLFNSMARRYIGERNRLMAAVFSAVRRHELIAAIVDQTNMISQLPPQTVDSLTKGLGVTLETLADPVSVHDNNSFCTIFPDVDGAFGGLPPFAKEKGGGESVLIRSGGSAIVLVPPENATASQCIRKVVDLVESSSDNPLSFSVMLSSDCFVNASSKLSIDDLRALDPRLCGEHNGFISYVEEIPAGVNSMSKSSSMFMLIQNERGRRHFPTHPSSMESIRSTIRTDVRVVDDTPASPSFSAMSTGIEPSAFPSMPQNSYSVQENPFAANPFAVSAGGVTAGNRGRGHRGRLFDLVGEEDTEEDQGMNILPMLDGLNMGNMFGNSNTNEDVDIEAISLMGIGLNGAYNGNQS